jgi:membrane associated rhomboid family serine protease
MATCYRHPSRETGVSCSNCARPICPDCMTPTSVGMRCPECSRQRTKVYTARSLQGTTQVTVAIIAINVLAFLASGAFGPTATSGSALFSFNDGTLYGPAIADSHEYWRLVTGGFLHAGFLHIAFNMYLLYVLGQMLEPAIGSVRFGVVYTVALLGGSFGALLLTPTSSTVGASGAVFGLMGAAFVELRARGVDPFQTGIGPLILINLGFSFFLSGISIGGHIGGLVAGGLATLAFHEGDRRRSRPLGYALCGLLAVIAVAAGIAAAGRMPTPGG